MLLHKHHTGSAIAVGNIIVSIQYCSVPVWAVWTNSPVVSVPLLGTRQQHPLRMVRPETDWITTYFLSPIRCLFDVEQRATKALLIDHATKNLAYV